MKLYHTTEPRRLGKIETEGLKINSFPNFSIASLEYMKEIYGVIPVFLSIEPGKYIDGAMLEVDASGLSLVADIPTLLSDYGAYLSDDNNTIWWKEDKAPDVFKFDEEIEIRDLLDPHSEYCKEAIVLTGTCAVMQDIAPERIKFVRNINESKTSNNVQLASIKTLNDKQIQTLNDLLNAADEHEEFKGYSLVKGKEFDERRLAIIDGNKAVGFLTPRKDGEYWRTGAIFIDPQEQNKGYASAAIKQFFMNPKYKPAKAWIADYNVSSQKAFLNSGFIKGERKDVGSGINDKGHYYFLNENIDLDINVGDTILGGRFKNVKTIVKKIVKDELNQPTVNDKKLLAFRIQKDMPEKKKEKETNLKEETYAGKYKAFWHITPESNLNLKRLGAYSPKHDAKGMFVTSSFKSILESWFGWVSGTKMRKAEKGGNLPKGIDFDGHDSSALTVKNFYIYKIAIPKELAKELEERFNQKAQEKGGGLGAFGWDLETFVPNEYFDQLKIVGNEKFSYEDLKALYKKQNKKSIEHYWLNYYRKEEEKKKLEEDYSEELNEETNKEKAIAFLRKVKNKNPELFNKLVDKAEWWLRKKK